ncbi:basic helix-loop-helix domain-containing transcription factor HLH54F [Lycorma delicatula]|uniref:basic helix-loop-helix domain-containing transcription factor HLH54F n=1 Tax=Lycorma delicatula TaxID=130591 RepID=UPI003F510D2D
MPRRRASEEEWEEERLIGGQQRNAANARERARMRVLSRAFCRLKTTLPWVPADTKLSKLDTLRLATSYIAHLRALLCLDQDDDIEQTNPVHPLNLTWPFTFQQSPGGNNNGGSVNGSVIHSDNTPSWNDNRHSSPLSTTSSSSSSGRSEDCNNLLNSTCNNNDNDIISNNLHYNNSNNNNNSATSINSYLNHHNHTNFHDTLLQIG